MNSAPLLVTAVDHPSLHGQLDEFLEQLRAERACSGCGSGRTPFPALIEQLAAPRMLRLGVVTGGRLVAVAAVDNDGAAAVAVLAPFRRRGFANELMEVVVERTTAIGYPPLHRFTAPGVRLAG